VQTELQDALRSPVACDVSVSNRPAAGGSSQFRNPVQGCLTGSFATMVP
jgi:hypothetical protein